MSHLQHFLIFRVDAEDDEAVLDQDENNGDEKRVISYQVCIQLLL